MSQTKKTHSKTNATVVQSQVTRYSQLTALLINEKKFFEISQIQVLCVLSENNYLTNTILVFTLMHFQEELRINSVYRSGVV